MGQLPDPRAVLHIKRSQSIAAQVQPLLSATRKSLCRATKTQRAKKTQKCVCMHTYTHTHTKCQKSRCPERGAPERERWGLVTAPPACPHPIPRAGDRCWQCRPGPPWTSGALCRPRRSPGTAVPLLLARRAGCACSPGGSTCLPAPDRLPGHTLAREPAAGQPSSSWAHGCPGRRTEVENKPSWASTAGGAGSRCAHTRTQNCRLDECSPSTRPRSFPGSPALHRRASGHGCPRPW